MSRASLGLTGAATERWSHDGYDLQPPKPGCDAAGLLAGHSYFDASCAKPVGDGLGGAPICCLLLCMDHFFCAQASTGTNGLPHKNVSHLVLFFSMPHVFIFYLAMKPPRRLLTNGEVC
jgi:hypothetical protein